MKIGIDLTWLTAVFLVAVRLGPLFIFAPVLGSGNTPIRMRILLAVALSAMLVAVLDPRAVSELDSFGALVIAALAELVLGMTLAFGLFAAFAAFLFGGRVLDLQIGFGLANLIDPSTRTQAPLLGTLLNIGGMALFFAVDGHHLIVRGLAYSLEQFPLGRSLTELDPSAVVAQFGVLFTYGLALVAPAVFALFLLDIVMALLGRTMPQMNVFMVSMPLKVAVGLLTLALSVQYLMPLVRRVFESIPAYWNDVLSLGRPHLVYG